MVWNNGSPAAGQKKGNFLHTHTKGVILTKDGGKISLCACTGWGWTMVKLGSEFLNSGVRNEPTIGLEAVRKGGTHPLPGSCTSPRDIWENKVAWSQSRVPSLSRGPEHRESHQGDQDQAVCLGVQQWVPISPDPDASCSLDRHLSCLLQFLSSVLWCSACKSPPWLNLFLGILFLLMQL